MLNYLREETYLVLLSLLIKIKRCLLFLVWTIGTQLPDQLYTMVILDDLVHDYLDYYVIRKGKEGAESCYLEDSVDEIRQEEEVDMEVLLLLLEVLLHLFGNEKSYRRGIRFDYNLVLLDSGFEDNIDPGSDRE